jgi:hypothetical protein
MYPTPEPAPSRGPDDTYLTRPLILAAVLVIAGHQIRGTVGPRPTHFATHTEEVIHHD